MTKRRRGFGRPKGPIYADLHLHSNQSDGTDSPAEVVKRAAAKGLKAIALTDHDTTAGNAEAQEAAVGEGITFLPGVEVSAEFDLVEVHILGLRLSPVQENDEMETRLAEVLEDRITRTQLMIEKLIELGVQIGEQDVAQEIAGAASPGRLHVARALYRIGVTNSVQEAFTRFIGIGKPAYVQKNRMPAMEAIELIHGRGGIASIAHPGIGGVHKKLRGLLSLPLDAVEVWHPEHSVGQSAEYGILVRENGLIATGGSDDHGSKTQRKYIGETGLNESAFQTLIARLEQV